MRALANYDLSTREGRYQARQAGFDVPLVVRTWSPMTRVVKGPSCWLYTGRVDKDGYGKFAGQRAHRAVWEFLRGPIPAGLILMHTCDVPACVNPDHLRVGTQADNMADKVAKGRQASGARHPRPSARITEDIVRDIRRRYRRGKKDGNLRELMAQYAIGQSAISRIVAGLSWAHV